MDHQVHTHLPRASEPQLLRHSWGVWGLSNAAVTYLFILLSAFGGAFNPVVALMLLIYAVVAVIVSAAILSYDRAILKEVLNFRRVNPFEGYGRMLQWIQHVFVCRDANVLREFIVQLDRELVANLGWDGYQALKIADRDRRLQQADARTFLGWQSGKSKRGGSIYFMARTSQKGQVCSIQWWVVVRGVIDAGDVRVFLAWAPFSLPFWIVPWLRGRHNTAAALRKTYDSFYEGMDLDTTVKSVQRLAFDILIAVLNRHGIDTTDLKQQAFAQINNYGTNKFEMNNFGQIGNIVQGMVQGGGQGAVATPKAGSNR